MTSTRFLIFLVILRIGALVAIASDEKTLAKTDKLPDGCSPQIAALIDPHGFEVKTAEGPVCDVWLVKSLTTKAGFKPTLNVKYPFQPGQLVGALRVGDKTEFTDFRGQPVKAGTYTLRYGQQPQDGNHIGTSEVLDFLLALPAASDVEPAMLAPPDKLHKASAKAAGTNHPAIFPLLPAESPVSEPTLSKEENNRWVLAIPAQASQGGKKIALPLRMVVIGKAE